AVLDERRERNAGALERRKDDEQRMVAEALGDFRFHVLLVLLDRDHLRGSGLAAARVGRALESATPGAFLDDTDHRKLHELDVFGLERYLAHQLRLERAPFIRTDVL